MTAIPQSQVGLQPSREKPRSPLSVVLRPVRGSLIAAVCLQVIASIAAVAPYVGLALLAECFIVNGAAAPPAEVWGSVALVIVGLLLRAFCGGGALAITHFADFRMQGELRRAIVARLGRAPLGWFTTHASGEVRKATQNDIDDVHYLVAHGAVETTAAIVTPLTGLAYLWYLDARLALLGVCTIPVYLVVYVVMTRGMAERMHEMNEGITRISKTIVEFVTGISVVKTFGRAGEAHGAYLRAADDFAEAYEGWVRPMMRTDALATIAVSAPVVLLVNLAGGTWFVMQGWITPVDAVVAALVAMTLPSAIMTVSFGMQARRTATAAAEHITELIDTPVLLESAEPQVARSAHVSFEHVSFSYEGEHLALEEVSLELTPGTVTALVGPSGSGKSTLASLLARFYDVDSGRIVVGGVDVRDIALDELYRTVGLVLQNAELVRASVLDNIRLGKPDASLEQVRAAAKAAQIDERILELPLGYDAIVGQDIVLSGGEAQRLSIARTLLADPPILILDEATAFADPESEARIQEALASLVAGRTLLVIAHRLVTIREADQIVVLDRGRVAERGTHDALVARQGVYAAMWRADEANTTAVWPQKGERA